MERGQILALALIVLALVLVGTVTVASQANLFFQNTVYSTASEQALNLAEAGVDKAVASLNASAGSYSGELETPLGNGSFSVVINSHTPTLVSLSSTGYIPSKSQAKAKRTVNVQASINQSRLFEVVKGTYQIK